MRSTDRRNALRMCITLIQGVRCVLSIATNINTMVIPLIYGFVVHYNMKWRRLKLEKGHSLQLTIYTKYTCIEVPRRTPLVLFVRWVCEVLIRAERSVAAVAAAL